MENNFGNCLICGKPAYLESHHVIPICYGGRVDGIQINICESCHHNIHMTAESIMAKTKKNTNYFENEYLLRKASPYIKAIMDAKRDFKEGLVDSDNRRRRMIVIQMSDNEWKRLHKAQRDSGYSNLMQYIEDLLRSKTKF